jgi:hypothetical protein
LGSPAFEDYVKLCEVELVNVAKNGSDLGPGRSSNVRIALVRLGPRESPETSTKMADSLSI